MLKYQIVINSKNQQALKFFFLFLTKKKNPAFSFIKTYTNKKQKTKKITVLKSPHVNKIAQDQFEYKIVSKQYNFNSYNSFKDLLILKKLKTKLFSDLKITVTFLLSKKESISTQTQLLNPSHYNLHYFLKTNQLSQKTLYSNFISINNIKPSIRIKNYLKILDGYGEIKLIL